MIRRSRSKLLQDIERGRKDISHDEGDIITQEEEKLLLHKSKPTLTKK